MSIILLKFSNFSIIILHFGEFTRWGDKKFAKTISRLPLMPFVTLRHKGLFTHTAHKLWNFTFSPDFFIFVDEVFMPDVRHIKMIEQLHLQCRLLPKNCTIISSRLSFLVLNYCFLNTSLHFNRNITGFHTLVFFIIHWFHIYQLYSYGSNRIFVKGYK